MSNAVTSVVKKVGNAVGIGGKDIISNQMRKDVEAASEKSGAEQRMQRRDRQEGAARAAGLRAARGRGRGYRSLLSQSRMEDQQGKGSKTTLGG